jgi:hypothetical protein
MKEVFSLERSLAEFTSRQTALEQFLDEQYSQREALARLFGWLPDQTIIAPEVADKMLIC